MRLIHPDYHEEFVLQLQKGGQENVSGTQEITGVPLCAFMSGKNSEQAIVVTIAQQGQSNPMPEHSGMNFWDP